MAFCANCGTKLDEGTKFCLQCGAQVEDGQVAPPPVQPIVQPPAYQIPPVYAPQGAPPPAPPLVATGWNYFWGIFRKYAVFVGRASMEEFLAAAFIYGLLVSVAGVIDGALFLYISNGVGVLTTLFSLATLLPLLAVTIRRMHDLDKSGWHCLIPVYGWFILPLCEGTKGTNRYGADPKQI